MLKLKNIKTKKKAITVKFTGDNKEEIEKFLNLRFDKTEDGGLFRLGERIPVGTWVVKEYDDCSKTYRCEHILCPSTTLMKKLYIKIKPKKVKNV